MAKQSRRDFTVQHGAKFTADLCTTDLDTVLRREEKLIAEARLPCRKRKALIAITKSVAGK